MCNHGCYKKIKKPRRWWRNRAGKICAAGWDATWRCLVDLTSGVADIILVSDTLTCVNVNTFLGNKSSPTVAFFVALNKNDNGHWRLRSFAFFFGRIASVRFAIDWHAHPNEVPWVMRELQLRCGKIKFFCPLTDEGKVIGPPALCSPPTHPLLSCLIQVLRISIDLPNRRR